MKHLKDNLLLRFSIATMILLTVLAVFITTSLSFELEQTINFLKVLQDIDEGKITASSSRYSIANLIRETTDLKFKASLLIGSGFLLLYVSLYVIARGGWKTITSQQRRLEAVNHQLQTTVNDLEQSSLKLAKEMEERQELEEQLQQSPKDEDSR